jgi:alanyl-tRNA synthetase
MVSRGCGSLPARHGVVVLDTRRSTPRAAARWATRAAIFSGAAMFEVADTQKIKSDVFGHHGTLKFGAR